MKPQTRKWVVRTFAALVVLTAVVVGVLYASMRALGNMVEDAATEFPNALADLFGAQKLPAPAGSVVLDEVGEIVAEIDGYGHIVANQGRDTAAVVWANCIWPEPAKIENVQ